MGISKPPGYKHPGKDARKGSVPTMAAPEKTKSPESPIRKKGAERSRSKYRDHDNEALGQKETVLMRLVVRQPVKGQLSTFDEMISAGLEPKVALLGMLKRGFPELKLKVSKGRYKTEANAIEFEGGPIETTRLVDVEFYKLLKSAFDPFDVLTDRAIGQTVGEAILVAVEGE